MQKAIAILLCITVYLPTADAQGVVTKEMEERMSSAIRDLVDTSVDSDGFRFLVPGLIRLCFHDCVMICDGCIDTRRSVQAGNNGLLATWQPIKRLANRFSDICTRADFIALACAVTSDYAAERGEQEGLCTKTEGQQVNDCRPNMKVLWGRRTCEVPQLVTPTRNLPDANQNPYTWFDKNMQMTPRQAVCIMGSHTLGKLRKNETGFSGDYTTQMDVLSNEFFVMMKPGTTWKQKKKFPVIDEFPQTRAQWEAPDSNHTRVNSDMMLMYRLGKLDDDGRSQCLIQPLNQKKKPQRCKRQPHFDIVEEMAGDNKAFIECFGDAMDAMLHTGYPEGDLVPTGEVIPPPTKTVKEPSDRRKNKRKRNRGDRNRGDRKKKNRLRKKTSPNSPSPARGSLAHLTNLILSKTK